MNDTDFKFTPYVNAWPRTTIVAGYIISLEQGARWANKVRNDPTRILPATIRLSPTVLLTIDEDFRKEGGIGVFYNIGDSLNENASARYIVATQAKRGNWWNTSREGVERERVMDPEIRFKEGEDDRRVLERLKENGEH